MNRKYIKEILRKKSSEKPILLNNFKKKYKVLLVYPNSYFIGMSNLGFHTIYKIINSHELFCCERCFIPEYNLKPLSFETQNFPEFFDIIIFSVSFEIDFINVIKFLQLSGIPLLKKDRKNFPIIAAGGIAITLNYKPLRNIIDYFIIGEGEDLINQFLLKIVNSEEPEELKGIVGDTKESTERAVYNGTFAHSIFCTKETEFSETFLIEIARGCKYNCNFCAASYNYSPYRINRFEKIQIILDKFLSLYKKVGIVGSTVTSHPDFIKICSYISEKKIPFSVTSLRLDSLNFDILDALLLGGNKSFTVAVEAATDTLREKINKKLTTEQIFEAISKFMHKKIINLKFYFIIGLPYESFDDVVEIVSFINQVRELYLSKKYFLKHLGVFQISINPFIPKANTPFYRFSMEKPEDLNKKIEYLKRNLNKIPNVNVKFENLELAYIQGLIAKGDFDLDKFLIEISKNKIKSKSILKKHFDMFEKYQVFLN